MPLFVLCAQTVLAQDLGEIARRQRQQNKQNPPAHVYTNDDLKRTEILVPEDRSRIEAARKSAPAENATENAAAPAPATPTAKPADLPLGDVARYYRELYRLQDAQQKSRENLLPGAPALAMPKLTMPEIAAQPRRPRGLRDPFSKAPQNSPVPFGASLPGAPDRPRRIPQPLAPKQIPAPQETAMVAPDSIIVRRGDSLWKLAAHYLGDGAKWHAILAANPQLSDPNRILVGERLSLPSEVHAPAETQNAGTLRVERGDSMWKLAQNHLGSGFAWSCIAQANPQIQNAAVIYPGQVLNVPATCGGGTVNLQGRQAPPVARASN